MSKNKNLILKAIILAVCLVAYFFTNGRCNIPIAAWIWPLCFLYLFRRSNHIIDKAIPMLLIFIITFSKWYGSSGGIIFYELISSIKISVLSIIPFVVDAIFYKRVKGIKATLILPLTFAVLEYIIMELFNVHVEAISSSQVGNEPLMQLASLIGPYGITFIIIWFATIAMYVYEHKNDCWKTIRVPIVMYSSILVAVLVFGGIRLIFASENTPTIKVAMTTGIEIYDDNQYVPLKSYINSMDKSVHTAADGGAEIIQFCEDAFYVDNNNELEQMLDATKQAAVKNNIAVLLSLEIGHIDNNQKELCGNRIYLIDQHGKIIFSYNKTHLVPMLETKKFKKANDIIPNASLTLPSGKTVKIAAVICFDSDFISYVRNGINSDTQLFLVPTWDWSPIEEFHCNFVTYRSIENGITTVRSTFDGITTAIDPYGRTITSNDTDQTGFENVVFADITTKRVFTLYSKIGRLTDWCYIIFLFTVISFAFTNKKADNEK